MSSEESDTSSVTPEESETLTPAAIEECRSAMQGESIPKNLRESRIIACIIHGLRHNEAFADAEPA